MENGQKSAEWEAQVFNRSRTREEYVKLVATLIWKLRDYNKKVYFNFNLGHIMKTQISGLKITFLHHRYDIEQVTAVKNQNFGFRVQTQKSLCNPKN